MTYRQLTSRLGRVYDAGEARAVARYLLEESFGLTMADILGGAIETLGDADTRRLEALTARLEKGEPVQYILGRAEFAGRWYEVGAGVLVPRPETESLCQRTIDKAQRIESPAILDIGTGSGCIACTLALALPQAQIEAWDISDKAIDIARRNADTLGAKVNYRRKDALNADGEAESEKWDIIVSNPPYIIMSERGDMAANVLDWEPSTALFVPDDDPLLFYRAIARYARKALRPKGSLLFEINPLFARELQEMLSREGYHNITITRDDCGRQRIADCTK